MSDGQPPAATDSGPEETTAYPLEKFTGDPEETTIRRTDTRVQGRVPPQATEVERAILGAMLVEQEAIPEVIDLLPQDAFYDRRNQEVFDAIVATWDSGTPADLVTVTETLKRRGRLEEIGGGYELAKLTQDVASTANVEHHARIVTEKYLARRTIEKLRRIIARAFEEDVFEVLQDAERSIYDLANERFLKGGLEHVSAGAERAMQRLDEWLAGNVTDRWATGIPTIDDAFSGGLPVGEVTTIGGHTSGYKTAFLVELVKRSALRAQKSRENFAIPVFSAEMTAEQIVHRAAANMARIPERKLRPNHKGRIKASDEEVERYRAQIEKISAMNIFVDPTPDPTPEQMRSRLLRLQSQHEIAFWAADYLEKINTDEDTREQQVAAAIKAQKNISKDLEIPGVALSQYKRGPKRRKDKRPTKEDYRFSGKIEHESYMCWHLHPPFYWIDRGEECSDYDETDPNAIYILCDKHRNGPIGEVRLVLEDRWGRFVDPKEPEEPVFQEETPF